MRALTSLIAAILVLSAKELPGQPIGEETSGYVHLQNGEEFQLATGELLARGREAFQAMWTIEEGGARPLTRGTGGPLANPLSPLVFPRNFNRISSMDSNGCSGCHNLPFAGGGGDFVTGVFVAGQRFDDITFDHSDGIPLSGAINEAGEYVTLPKVANYRATLGMFGSGYIEMLARQMTADLQAIRDATVPGTAAELRTKGISFGSLARAADGSWLVADVEGLPEQSLLTGGPLKPPSLIIHPFHQSGSVVSLRQFTNNAFNHHHGMQSEERFGYGIDADGDGLVNELTRADITAATVWQASLQVPGQVVPRDHEVEEAIIEGEDLFHRVGCAGCHLKELPLDDKGWIFTEPNPYNPPGNLQPGNAPTLEVDLSNPSLPGRRLQPRDGVVMVPAFTDLKLHDITSGPADPNREPLNINQPGGSPGFFASNSRFLTKKLWGAANERPYFHHGKYTTLREATLAHAGEAVGSRTQFEALSKSDQDRIIEFLKSLQVLPADTKFAVVDEIGRPRPNWPSNRQTNKK